MPHLFVVRKGDEVFTYEQYEDIPEDFDHLIEFRPEIPPPPHTPEEHDEIDSWLSKFERLMEIEHARSSKTR